MLKTCPRLTALGAVVSRLPMSLSAALPWRGRWRHVWAVPENARERWLRKLRASLDDGTFVKLTLSKPRERKSDLRNVYGRIVDLRAGRMFSITLRHATRDTTRNVAFAEAIAQVGSLLGDV